MQRGYRAEGHFRGFGGNGYAFVTLSATVGGLTEPGETDIAGFYKIDLPAIVSCPGTYSIHAVKYDQGRPLGAGVTKTGKYINDFPSKQYTIHQNIEL